jgi:hypothetical protein
MLLWPTVAVLGFFALNTVVIALGTSSTARYELELDGAQHHREPSTPAGSGTGQADDGSASGPVGRYRSWLRGGASVRERRPRHSARVDPVVAPGGEGGGGRGPAPVSGRPAAGRQGSARTMLRVRPKPDASPVPGGSPAVQSAPAVGWWVIAGLADPGGDRSETPRVVAGPFVDQLEADWAALAGPLPASASARVVFGLRRGDGALVGRPSPQERAWLAELGQQLDRLSDDWDTLISDTDELTSLVVEVTAALVEAGLPLYDGGHGTQVGGAGGGVCLTPDPGRRGILVTWRQHDRMSVHQVRGAAADVAVQQTMSAAIADVLAQLGFRVEPSVSRGCHLVTA